MKKLNLYIETSVFGFYYDEDVRNFYKREVTTKLFNQIRKGLFEGYKFYFGINTPEEVIIYDI